MTSRLETRHPAGILPSPLAAAGTICLGQVALDA